MKTFKHLSQNDRDRMEILLSHGISQTDIAKLLKVHSSTISRETRYRQRRNGEYDATYAGHKAYVKRKYSKYQGMKVEFNKDLRDYVIENLMKKRSPDEISGRMKKESQSFYVGKDAIYKWLYSPWGQKYTNYLCTQRHKKKKHKKSRKREMIPNATSIYDRPLGAINKSRYGHFEFDTAVAPKKVNNNQAIAVGAERKSKLIIASKIQSLACKYMTKAITNFNDQFLIKSGTLDRGIENRHHENWNIQTYFADPHSPWQKPLVENSIGLLRRWFFKKGTDWSKINEHQLQTAIHVLNNKYRKSLGYKSALEIAQKNAIIKNDPPENCI